MKFPCAHLEFALRSDCINANARWGGGTRVFCGLTSRAAANFAHKKRLIFITILFHEDNEAETEKCKCVRTN